MLCNECGKNEASVHAVTIINGVRNEMHLCPECASKHPELSRRFESLAAMSSRPRSLFRNLLNFGFDTDPFEAMENILSCPTCGETLDDIRKTGLFGCSDCYDTFSDQIIPVLEKTQGSSTHKEGEVQKENGQNIGEAVKEEKKPDRLTELQEALKKAISEEAFEKAAEIRDEIKKIKGE